MAKNPPEARGNQTNPFSHLSNLRAQTGCSSIKEIGPKLFNDVLARGNIPSTWSKTVFIMLAKKAKAIHASDFRPIAVARLLYKTFAYLVLGRVKATSEVRQPEEQHGFTQNYSHKGTFADNEFVPRQGFHARHCGVAGGFGLVESIWPRMLAGFVASLWKAMGFPNM